MLLYICCQLFEPNIAFTLERALTVFTRSDITPPKVNRFGRNMEDSEKIFGGWAWKMFFDPRSIV